MDALDEHVMHSCMQGACNYVLVTATMVYQWYRFPSSAHETQFVKPNLDSVYVAYKTTVRCLHKALLVST